MQTTSKQQILTTVLSSVLEEMAFLAVDAPEDALFDEENGITVRIHFSGARRGSLTLRTDAGFGEMLAANLLGIDEDDSDARLRAQDAAKELMNVVCGHLVSELFGTAELVELTIPESIAASSDAPLPAGEDVSSSRVEVEGHPVELTLVIN